MTRQYDVRRSSKSPQKKGSDDWILQRSAVRQLPAKTVTPQTETVAGDRSGIKLDLMQIPVSNHSAMPVQAKLEIRPAGDKYEQEADQVAKQVVQQLNGSQSGKLQQQPTLIGQKNPEVEEELQRKPGLQLKGGREGMTTTPELESSITRSRGSGQPLSQGIREPMEKAFGGVDFSGVKVHTDGQSDRLNQSMQAKAFTTGQDVFFRQGAYDPGSQGGKELIAHELTHVVQQTGSTQQRQIRAKPNEAPLSSLKPKPKISASPLWLNIQLGRDRTNKSGNSSFGIQRVPLRPDGREDIPYYSHPAFPVWSRLCQEADMGEEEIHQSFMDVMGGVRAGLEAKNPRLDQHRQQEAQLVARELMEKFAKARTKELGTPTGGLVLWSGCKELASKYAKENGGKALADTDLGKAIDAVEFWSEAKDYAITYWDILGPFWEEVSRQLAKTSIGDVTVIVTSNRENTVFHRVEKFALENSQKVRFLKAAPVSEGSREFTIVSGPYESWEAIKPHLPDPS
ncbi:eCIS core domain-containing protein [Moorena producens]|uniref:eCIS core domain-containing protein n=1 Tax=Moorena producens TaxID=1155739 RepID=UPI003C749A41